jgi:hypothetical protein
MCPLFDQKHDRTHDAKADDNGEVRRQKFQAHTPERGATTRAALPNSDKSIESGCSAASRAVHG